MDRPLVQEEKGNWIIYAYFLEDALKALQAKEPPSHSQQHTHGAEPAEITPYWVCEKCTTVNGLDKTKCLGCGKEKTAQLHHA